MAFAVIAVVCVVDAAVALLYTRALGQNARGLVDNILLSIRLVTRLEHDVDLERILVSEHVLEKDSSKMAAIEDNIATIDADAKATAQAYEPWAILDTEREMWARAKSELAATEAPRRRVLELSRRNLDEEARATMVTVDARYDGLERDFERLIALNDAAAVDAALRIGGIRWRVQGTVVVAGVLEVLGVLVVAVVTLRLDGRVQSATARYLSAIEERNRDLDAFAARVAHDIRGPLTTINLASARLAKAAPQEHKSSEIIHRGIGRMEALIEDLLALGHIEERAGGTCDPADVAAQVQGDLAGRIEIESGAIRVHADHARASGSEGLLRQALVNLTENAIKYRRADAAPQIDIAGAVNDGRYVLRVSDNGMGMSPDEAAHAFDPFYRAPSARDRPGTGLGLSIVKRVVEAVGGNVSIVESRVGGGTTFEIHLPLAR